MSTHFGHSPKNMANRTFFNTKYRLIYQIVFHRTLRIFSFCYFSVFKSLSHPNLMYILFCAFLIIICIKETPVFRDFSHKIPELLFPIRRGTISAGLQASVFRSCVKDATSRWVAGATILSNTPFSFV